MQRGLVPGPAGSRPRPGHALSFAGAWERAMSFRNLKIAYKMTLVLLIMAATTLAAVLYANVKTGQIITDYADLTENRSPALLAVVRANVRANNFDISLVRAITFPNEDLDAVLKNAATYNKEMRDYLVQAAKLDPENASFYRQYAQGFDPFYADMVRGIELVRAGKLEEAKALAQKFLPAITAHRRSSTPVINAVGTRISTNSDRLQDEVAGVRLTNYLVVGGGILVALIIGFLISRGAVAAPIIRLGATMRRLAEGDLSAEVEGQDGRDEVGGMAQAVEVFKQNAIAARDLEERQKEMEADAQRQRKAELARLADMFEGAVGSIVSGVATATVRLQGTASTLTQTAASTQSLSSGVANASDQASNNVQTVAAAAEELASSVSEISRQVETSSQIATEAVRQAQKTDARIGTLSQAASRIGDVVELITAIAGQTNLLALNATIEAARAGDAGKGFAVVAQEVKALAAQTGKATEEISGQITEIQQATAESVQAMKEIGETINRIAEIAQAIAAAVQEQGTATAEISRNIQQAAAGTAQVSTNIAEVTRGAAATGEASEDVMQSARALAQQGESLKTQVDGFLNTVRAA
ncbi:histidine kinase [Azorhizobium caulinodans ORS 571]|uniref:Histidine kinase n=2 Tax=Azorhizobium caulinodans TaxID=7 RepID=A8IPZ0_AZOC5|nr:histidine kinase [Azorhizobium caulinodans ORS 571]